MDFNDLNSRIRRIEISLQERYDYDIESNTKIVSTNFGQGVQVTFNQKYSKEQLTNKILLLLHNLATLKDHIKNTLQTKNLPGTQIINQEIEKSLHLGVLLDLINKDKHGEPTRTNHSKKNPTIKDMEVGMMPIGKSVEIIFSPDGKMNFLAGSGQIEINAQIYDDQGNRLFSLDELTEESYKTFSKIIKEYNLL